MFLNLKGIYYSTMIKQTNKELKMQTNKKYEILQREKFQIEQYKSTDRIQAVIIDLHKNKKINKDSIDELFEIISLIKSL